MKKVIPISSMIRNEICAFFFIKTVDKYAKGVIETYQIFFFRNLFDLGVLSGIKHFHISKRDFS